MNHFLFLSHNTKRISIMIKLIAHKGEPGLIMTYELLSKLNFHFFFITITLEMHENTSKPTEIKFHLIHRNHTLL